MPPPVPEGMYGPRVTFDMPAPTDHMPLPEHSSDASAPIDHIPLPEPSFDASAPVDHIPLPEPDETRGTKRAFAESSASGGDQVDDVTPDTTHPTSKRRVLGVGSAWAWLRGK